MSRDETWMKRALALAERGRPHASPNPLVGAVVVRNGKVTGEGYHAYFGGPHAEAVALRKAGRFAREAALYVTLEPCSTWGKTPPCVDTIIGSRVSRVIIGSADPNPENYRLGIRQLKKAGIQVRIGVLAQEVQKQNPGFFKRMRTGLPFVTLKMAQSLDGKIATAGGESRWVTSETSRRFVHRLRAEADAVLVGKNTALQDNPRLEAKTGDPKPWRVVLDPDLELPRSARIFKGAPLTFVAVSEKRLKEKGDRLLFGKKVAGPHFPRILIPIPEKGNRLELKALLRKLASLGVNHLLVEGGGEVAWSLIHERLVDRFVWMVAPKIIGGRSAKTSVEGEGIQKLEKAFLLRWEKVSRLGSEWIFEAAPRRD